MHRSKPDGWNCAASLWMVLVLLVGWMAPAVSHAAEALLGTWQGELVINQSTKLTVQFIVNRTAPGKFAAVLNVPEQANLQNINVNSFSLVDDKVSFVVDEVNGNFEGQLKNGRIAGKWKQNGTAFDLALAPQVRQKIPAATIAQIDGSWKGVLSIPGTDRKLALVMNFSADPKSESGVSATIDSPEQSAYGIPVDRVAMQDGVLSVKVLRPEMGFSGRLEGGQLVGKWIQGGSAPLTFSKGKYQSAGLSIDKAVRDRLRGNWYGKFSNGIGLAMSFKDGSNGQFYATLDSPYEGRRGVPVTSIKVDGDRIAMRLDGVGATFTGSLGKDGITGKFAADGQDRTLTFQRGEFVAEVLQVPPDTAARLLGRWEGKTANTYMVLRFQKDERGGLVALQDIPNRQLFALPVSDIALKGDDLTLTVKGISAEFKGKLSQSAISGDWTMPSLQFPLKLTRTSM